MRISKAGLCVEAHHVLLDALRQCLMGLCLISRCSSFYGHKMETQLNPQKDKHNSHTNQVSFCTFFGLFLWSRPKCSASFLVWCGFLFTLQFFQESKDLVTNPHMCEDHSIIGLNRLGQDEIWKVNNHGAPACCTRCAYQD